MQITLHHTGFILGVPGEHPPGMYFIENGEITACSALAVLPIPVEEAPHLVIEDSVSVVDRPPILAVNELTGHINTSIGTNNGG